MPGQCQTQAADLLSRRFPEISRNLDASLQPVHNGTGGRTRGAAKVQIRTDLEPWVGQSARVQRQQSMSGAWGENFASLALLSGVLIGLAALGFYVISKVGAAVKASRVETSEMLSNFDEMRDQGVLSDAEYRTIKSMLVERLQTELKDSSESG
jgi:hypothetical protein